MAHKTGPITGALNDADRENTAAALQTTLTELVDLHLMGKQAHWNVVGPQFRAVHAQLDELVSAARGFADEVAERSVAIGVPPDGRAATVAATSGLGSFSDGWKSDHEVIETIVGMLAALITRMRARIDETDKSDLVTQDLLIRISAALEKSHWMWQAQLSR